MLGIGKKVQNNYMEEALGYSIQAEKRKEYEAMHKGDPKRIKRVMKEVLDKGVDPGISLIEEDTEVINNLFIELDKITEDVREEKIGEFLKFFNFFLGKDLRKSLNLKSELYIELLAAKLKNMDNEKKKLTADIFRAGINKILNFKKFR